MPKMKTHKGASKRFKKTGSGKLKRSHTGNNHLFYNKGKKANRRHDKAAIVFAGDQKRMEQLLTYR